ncbi:MAG: thermonuclease family protein [Synergistaceae bacterium]|nr:thermonuclease family protein [Synergistaceae bacterium]
MARARKKANKNISLEELKALGPVKLILLGIIIIAAYFFNGELPSIFQTEPEPVTQTQTQSQSQNPSGIIEGIVSKVVDGDTAVIRVDGQDRRVRLLGVDTPETVHPNKPVQFYGKEASNFTKQSLTGRRVWLEYDKSPLDRYQRHLAYVWLERPDSINENTIRREMFNARLLLGGYAKVMIINPNRRYKDLFNKFQSEAQSSRKGLWAGQ